MSGTDRRGLLRLLATGAVAVGGGALLHSGTAGAALPPPPFPVPPLPPLPPFPVGGCLAFEVAGRKVKICLDPPQVSIDGVPLQIQGHHGMFMSNMNMNMMFDNLPDLAVDVVRQLFGSALIPMPAPMAMPRGFVVPEGPQTPTTRKNITALTRQERAGYIAAILTLKRNGAYDYLIDLHMQAAANHTGGLHQTPAFAPWHRAHLILMELQLRKIDPALRIPYWNWTEQRSSTDFPLTPDFMGGDGYLEPDAGRPGRPQPGEVTTGPFAYKTGDWPLRLRPDKRPYLQRTLARIPLMTVLPTPAELADLLSIPIYDREPFLTGNNNFRDRLEGWSPLGQWTMHNRVHGWVGGSMVASSSPNDPIFWSHHGFIDKIWADWQHKYPTVPHYLPEKPATANFGLWTVPGLDTPMEPFLSRVGWRVTPRDMLTPAEYL